MLNEEAPEMLHADNHEQAPMDLTEDALASFNANVEPLPGAGKKAPSTVAGIADGHVYELARLESYILEAEKNYIDRPDKPYSSKDIFRRGPLDAINTTPFLRPDHINRIIVYTGCFNPPHRAHRELLCHAYLRTDYKTIAAMIVPVGRDVSSKPALGAWDKSSKLTQKERARLWQDELLERWSWVFPGTGSKVKDFIDRLCHFADRDGYQIEFVVLGGSDHVTVQRGVGSLGWGNGSMITSDVTRPANFVIPDGTPLRLPKFGRWRKILPGRSVQDQSREHCWLRQKSCWPCKKFKAMYPEFAHASQIESLDCFGGDAKHILQRCHEGDGSVWICDHSSDRNCFLLYLPSGRQYLYDKARVEISSTNVRQLFKTCPKDQLYEKLKDMVLNPRLLMIILGLDDCWLPCNDWKAGGWKDISSATAHKDDWSVLPIDAAKGGPCNDGSRTERRKSI